MHSVDARREGTVAIDSNAEKNTEIARHTSTADVFGQKPSKTAGF